MFNYPYARTREALEALASNGAPDPYHGHKLRYVNPASGEFAMPTIAHLCSAAAGRVSRASPTARPTAPCLSRSRARAKRRVGDTVLRAGSRTTSSSCRAGCRTPTTPTSEAVLFSFSDRSVQEKLGLWRETRGNA